MKGCRIAIICFAILMSAAANAMPISQFDKMSADDGGEYVTLLVKGSVEGLESRGHKAEADKLYELFNSEDGRRQFFRNLDILRALDHKNAADPNNKQPPYEVEQVFLLTLKQNGITVPLSFLLTINKDFKPQHSSTKQ